MHKQVIVLTSFAAVLHNPGEGVSDDCNIASEGGIYHHGNAVTTTRGDVFSVGLTRFISLEEVVVEQVVVEVAFTGVEVSLGGGVVVEVAITRVEVSLPEGLYVNDRKVFI